MSTWPSLHKIILDVDPEVVIFDSLVRFFNGDENSNPVMSKVMQRMRSLCAFPKERDNGAEASSHSSDHYRTSIIIHHNRKESPGFERSYSAAMMRGASAIHSEADLIITTFLVNRETQVSMNFSARKISSPGFKVVELDPETLLMREATRVETSNEVESINVLRIPYIMDVLEEAFRTSTDLSWPAIQKQVEAIPGSPDEGIRNAPELYSKTFKTECAEFLEEDRRKYRLKQGYDRSEIESKLKAVFSEKALRLNHRSKRKRNHQYKR